MKIAVLTSSRADYGIYLPLLKRMKLDQNIQMAIVAFGTHCSDKFGATVNQIEKDGFKVPHKIINLLEGDSPLDISKSYALTADLFAEFWSEHLDFDWVLVLGDRFEMAAAVNAGIPFGIKFAHLHAGETTLGAIDETYRHQISLASKLHFVSTAEYANRIHGLMANKNTAINVGALSLENLVDVPFLSKEEFLTNWDIDLSIPTILMTVHPETVSIEKNSMHVLALKSTIPDLLENHQIVITLPNADTHGEMFRNCFFELQKEHPGKVILIENFGSQSYFTCMKYADLLLGNTSSGIIEAASFKKFVINLGDRQKGRLCSNNVVSVGFEKEEILKAFEKLKGKDYLGTNIYYQKDSSLKILNHLKK